MAHDGIYSTVFTCLRSLTYPIPTTSTPPPPPQLDGVFDFISGIEKLTAGIGGGATTAAASSQSQQQREEMRRGIEAGKRGVRAALDFLNGAVGGNGGP